MKSLACGAYTVGGGGVEKGEYQFADLKGTETETGTGGSSQSHSVCVGEGEGTHYIPSGAD